LFRASSPIYSGCEVFLSSSDPISSDFCSVQRYIYQMAGPTVYHGVAQKVYLVKEAVIGMSLGLVAGAVWKYSHWERRKEIQSYYDKKSSK